MQRFLRLVCVCLLLGAGIRSCSPAQLISAESPDVASEKSSAGPILVISSAGAERLLDDVEYFCETAGRPYYATLTKGFLAAAGDLKGIDRSQPFGAMLVIDPGKAPDPVFVGFIPLTDIEKLAATLRAGSVKLQKIEKEDNRYQLVLPEETWQGTVQGKYLFLAHKAVTLDRRFPDPVALTKPLTDRYDLAVSILFRNAPQDMKQMIVDFLRAHFAGENPRERNESERQHKNRLAQNHLLLNGFEKLFLQGDALTLGWNLSRKERTATLEVAFDAKSSSSSAGMLKRMGNVSSRFANLHRGTPALLASSTLKLQKSERERLLEILESILNLNVNRVVAESPHRKQVEALLRSLQATLNSGFFDFAFRFDGKEPGRFVVRGGLKVVQEQAVNQALTSVLQQFGENDAGIQMQTEAVSHGGITFHRAVRKSAGFGERLLFGDRITLYVGAGSGVLWVSLGAEDQTLPALKQMFEQASNRSPDGSDRNTAAIFHLTSSLSAWLPVLTDESGSLAKLAGEAFSRGDDTFSVDCRTTETGMRLRLRFDAGFIRLAGLSLVRELEGSR